ncbi:MAG: hypothetical protein JWP78_1169 [Mucilaginibacter sp.]|nr:hypothetical protein [Mucilaginibacter sp.]
MLEVGSRFIKINNVNMLNKLTKSPTINRSITKKVIELHNSGYVFDFLIADSLEIICLQDNRYFLFENVLIKIVDQGYDLLSRSYKYIHTIETYCGDKGLLLNDAIYTSGFTNNQIILL